MTMDTAKMQDISDRLYVIQGLLEDLLNDIQASQAEEEAKLGMVDPFVAALDKAMAACDPYPEVKGDGV
ncbi:MAG: hypothetical protein IPI58_09730 [Alphaproteobacteria bacterium]|nr:MAG: hypothetical protein IPI58_09730 [Alphaproteobacteria bacterium]